MVASAPDRVVILRGKLVKEPTDLALPYPHGGTPLGIVRNAEWRFQRRYFSLEAEEFGTTVETIFLGDSGVLACVSRDLDSDFLRSAFTPTIEGAATGRVSLSGIANREESRAGRREGEELACKLYLSPESPQHHGVLLYRAVPMVDEAAAINYNLREDAGVLCLFLATPDDGGLCYQIGPRGDLTL